MPGDLGPRRQRSQPNGRFRCRALGDVGMRTKQNNRQPCSQPVCTCLSVWQPRIEVARNSNNYGIVNRPNGAAGIQQGRWPAPSGFVVERPVRVWADAKRVSPPRAILASASRQAWQNQVQAAWRRSQATAAKPLGGIPSVWRLGTMIPVATTMISSAARYRATAARPLLLPLSEPPGGGSRA